MNDRLLAIPTITRMQIKQTDSEARETMDEWNELTELEKSYYLSGPDGYREETDDEFRTRIKLRHTEKETD